MFLVSASGVMNFPEQSFSVWRSGSIAAIGEQKRLLYVTLKAAMMISQQPSVHADRMESFFYSSNDVRKPGVGLI
jgi:hypothetical protein